jgi:hypothetical protein
MSYDLSILRALVRLSRRHAADAEALRIRAGGGEAEVRASLARLERQGLALRTARGPRPTLAGVAIALAAAPARRPAKALPRKALRRAAA